MLHFIPAWYQKNQWCENEQCWQERRMKTEFDDTVKQIQLFHRNQIQPYQILLLSYTPNFRHFLHRQSVYHAPYWSCFDAIQEIRRQKSMVLSFHNLSWPKDIEFLYTPLVVVAMWRGAKYAQVEFGEDGNMIRVELYNGNKICRQNIYDDRGFVSSTILYDNGEPVRQDYLMENGQWKLRHFLEDGHVEINPENPKYMLNYLEGKLEKSFSRQRYDSMEEVIGEVFAAYVDQSPDEDMFCIAMHEQHLELMQKVLIGKRRTILSFFQGRYKLEDQPDAEKLLQKADYIVTDSREASERILAANNRVMSKITDITPYDSRADLGISQQLSIQKIMVPVDGLDKERLSQLIRYLGQYLSRNDRARVHLFTRNADIDSPRLLLEYVRSCLTEYGMKEAWVDAEREIGLIDHQVEEESPLRFFVEQCVDELSVSRCMREQRVIVDMRELPELYLQISAISMGIPQIVITKTQYVEDRRNGLILAELSQLPQTLDYYLNGLVNWNEAVVASYELGKRFSTRVLIDKWKRVLEFVEGNK